jgi:hypothetical protein
LRPQYENEGDWQAEVKIMERVAKALGFSDFRKLPASYVLDFAAIRGDQITGFVEVKRRHNKMSQYPGYLCCAA